MTNEKELAVGCDGGVRCVCGEAFEAEREWLMARVTPPSAGIASGTSRVSFP